MPTAHETASAASPRRRGFGRVLIAVYAVFAFSASARSTVQLVQSGSEAPVAYGLSAFSALVYVVATIALAVPGRTAYRLSWITIGIELAGVLVVGLLSVTVPDLFQRASVWSQFGMGYGFVPLVLPIIGMIWLRRIGR
ncbi:MAG: hypothetical protein L0G99_09220 [Propionibacteriales bacterium]|nr:hypothetical protein [Propionibacteriales bacterium]